MRSNRRGLMLLLLLAGLLVAAGCTLIQTTKAVIAVSVQKGVVPLTLSFDGAGSEGAGGVSTYHWTFGTGDESYDAAGSYTYHRAGIYELSLTIRGENGRTATTSVQIAVDPALWVCDENLQQVYKLDMNGAVLETFDVPVADPRGVAVAEIGGTEWLFVACYGGGNQRILKLDATTGVLDTERSAPGGDPLFLTYGVQEPERLWHVDGLSRRIYELAQASWQVMNGFGTNYFRTTGQVGNETFLQTPMGLDWTEELGSSGFLWYLEGETRWLYQFDVDAPINIFEGVQLVAVGEPIEIDASLFPVAGIDIYDGWLWVVDRDHHEIVQVDLTTGLATGVRISGFPGAAVSGLHIQY